MKEQTHCIANNIYIYIAINMHIFEKMETPNRELQGVITLHHLNTICSLALLKRTETDLTEM